MTRPTLLGLLFLSALAAQPASAQRLTGTHPSAALPRPVTLDTTGRFLAKYASVGEDVLIAGQPTADALRELQRQGVTTVVNLRMPDEMARVPFDEAVLVKELGMEYVYLPVRGGTDHPYAPETVRRFADAMASAKGKVLLHCTIAWRASHLWAAYLIQYRGVAADSALANARLINLMDDHRQGESGRQPVEDFLGRDLPQLAQRRDTTSRVRSP